MQDSSPDVTNTAEPTSRASVASLASLASRIDGRPALTDAELAEAWFDAPPPSTRRPSVPPAPVSVVGEFIGDPLADGWLR